MCSEKLLRNVSSVWDTTDLHVSTLHPPSRSDEPALFQELPAPDTSG